MIIKINKYISRPALAFLHAEHAHTPLICLSNYFISIILIAFYVNKTFGWLFNEELRDVMADHSSVKFEKKK